MAIPLAPRAPARARLRLPRRTARLRRLTALYGALFLACGAVLLAVSYVLAEQAIAPGETSTKRPSPRSRFLLASSPSTGAPTLLAPANCSTWNSRWARR